MGADDQAAARVLIIGALGITPYVDRAMEILALAERGHDPEHRALLIARDGTVAGIALYGTIAGAEGAAKLHVAVLAPGVDANDVGARLLDAVGTRVAAEGARFLLAELPDDPAMGSVYALLRAHGFREDARVPDFYREGVALTFLRRTLLV
jgi:L-amino acid N-acyltransferase YncA